MTTQTSTLKNVLESFTVEGELYERLENGKLRCFACGHRCVIADGLDGICRVRFNRGGKLLVPHGYVGGAQLDPVEKKKLLGDGNYGGFYQRSDEEMLAMWRVAVEETRALMQDGWA